VEIRNPPGSRKEYFSLSEPEIKVDAVRFRNEGLKVSFVNTSLLKFGWPGSEPVRRKPEEPAAREKRWRPKRRFGTAAWRTSKGAPLRPDHGRGQGAVFTGSRVEDPATMLPRIVDVLGEMALAAERQKTYLLIENEASQNVATSGSSPPS